MIVRIHRFGARVKYFALGLFFASLLSAAFAASVQITGRNSEQRNSIFQMGIPALTRDEAITATAAGTQVNSYQLTAGLSQITVVASGNDSVKLPSTTYTPIIPGAPYGINVVIVNQSANTLGIFPFLSTDTINGGGAGAIFTGTTTGKVADCFVVADGKWWCQIG